MNFENVFRLEATEIWAKNRENGYPTLKVFNPEASTEQFNVHPVIRKVKIDGGIVYVLAEKPDSTGGVSDEYLTYVLVYYNGQYVTWLCNYSDGGGFHYGNYHSGDFQGAVQDFMLRSWEHLLPKATKSKEWQKLRTFVDDELAMYGDHHDPEATTLIEVQEKMEKLEGEDK
jgi:hypothetical protein